VKRYLRKKLKPKKIKKTLISFFPVAETMLDGTFLPVAMSLHVPIY